MIWLLVGIVLVSNSVIGVIGYVLIYNDRVNAFDFYSKRLNYSGVLSVAMLLINVGIYFMGYLTFMFCLKYGIFGTLYPVTGLILLIVTKKKAIDDQEINWVIAGMVVGILFGVVSFLGYLLVFLTEKQYLTFK